MTRQRLTSRFLKINLIALSLLHAGFTAPAYFPRQKSSAPSPAQPPDATAPVTIIWLLDALRPTEFDIVEITTQVERRGVDFRMSGGIEMYFRERGATPALIEAARRNYRGPFDRKELEAMLRLTRQRPPRTTVGDVVGEVKKRGVVFKLTPQNTAALQKSGATKDVIVAARDNYRADVLAANPRLPFPAKRSDPMLLRTDPHSIPYGISKPPAQGSQGSGGAMGTGSGVGTGTGEGIGPGRGSNTGGGDPSVGGGGPGDTGPVDYTRVFKQNEVTKKAVIISNPKPSFTEEAKNNNVTGVVRLRVVFHSSGKVTNISVVKGLPDGLTERAIAAAMQIEFQPAQKDRHIVSQYIILEYNFNPY